MESLCTENMFSHLSPVIRIVIRHLGQGINLTKDVCALRKAKNGFSSLKNQNHVESNSTYFQLGKGTKPSRQNHGYKFEERIGAFIRLQAIKLSKRLIAHPLRHTRKLVDGRVYIPRLASVLLGRSGGYIILKKFSRMFSRGLALEADIFWRSYNIKSIRRV